MKRVAQLVATIMVLSITASVLWTLGRTMIVGQYWMSATLPMTVLAGLVFPVAVIASTYFVLKSIWKL